MTPPSSSSKSILAVHIWRFFFFTSRRTFFFLWTLSIREGFSSSKCLSLYFSAPPPPQHRKYHTHQAECCGYIFVPRWQFAKQVATRGNIHTTSGLLYSLSDYTSYDAFKLFNEGRERYPQAKKNKINISIVTLAVFFFFNLLSRIQGDDMPSPLLDQKVHHSVWWWIVKTKCVNKYSRAENCMLLLHQ